MDLFILLWASGIIWMLKGPQTHAPSSSAELISLSLERFYPRDLFILLWASGIIWVLKGPQIHAPSSFTELICWPLEYSMTPKVASQRAGYLATSFILHSLEEQTPGTSSTTVDAKWKRKVENTRGDLVPRTWYETPREIASQEFWMNP